MPPPSAGSSRLLVRVLRDERRALTGLGALLTAAMLLPLLGPLLLGRFVDEAGAGRPMSALVELAIAYLVVTLASEGLVLLVVWLSVGISWRAGNRLREDLADHALALDLAWHGRHSAGILIERIDGDVEAMFAFVGNFVLNVVGNAILVAGVLAVSVAIDWRAAAVLGLAAAVGFGVMSATRTLALPAHDDEREAKAVLLGDVEERLGGLEDLRANGAGPYAVHRLHAHSARAWRASRRAGTAGGAVWASSAGVLSLGSVAVLATGIALHERGALTVGAVLALFRYSQMLRDPLQQIAAQLKEFQKAAAGAARAARLLATPLGVLDGPRGPEALAPGALSVELDRVCLAYDAGHDVLHDVTLRLAPGTHLGLIGRTGSGKTSVGRLVLRFWDVRSGAVRLGGVDVRDLRLDVLRSRAAVVTQDVELLRASLRDNLTVFGAVEADDAALTQVLADVGLGPWLSSLADGLDTHLDGPGSLSAGEAQLLAFARAFLRQPDVVVLDEPSSRLDPATEARISAATRRLLQGRTAIVVAHRLETLDDVDEIAVMEGGRVVEHGRRAALAADPASAYARLRAAGVAVVAEERSA